jgi:outer membrane protein assembly factor BamB
MRTPRVRAGLFVVVVVAGALSALVSTVLADAQHWPQFRGPDAGVAADDSALPDTWSETENVAWKIDVPGRGWSSPVVWGDHVFITTAIGTRQARPAILETSAYLGRSTGGTMTRADVTRDTDEHRWMLYDIDLQTGRVLWERVVHRAVPGQGVHLKNSYASETPVTDGQRVYVYLGYAGLFAFNMDGTPAWAKPMEAFETGLGGWGPAASPALHDGRIYIVNDNETRSFAAAFDARTGAELWRVAREERSNWSTPFVWQNALRTEIVTTGTRRTRSYDTSGRLLWELSGMTSVHAATPFSKDGLLYVSSGYFTDPRRPVYAIRPGASGDISLKADESANAFIAWSQPTLSSCYPSALVVGGQYYTLMDRGFLTSNDAKTGKEIYGRQRISGDSSAFSASPWSYNGRIFALSEDGDTFVMQAGPEFKLLGRNSLNELTLASPAVAGGSLIIRTATKLYRIKRP